MTQRTRRKQRGVFRHRSRQYYFAGRRRAMGRVGQSLPLPPESLGLSAYVDWSGNGDYSVSTDNVSGDLLRREDVSIRYGRDQQRSMSPIGPGEASYLLNNVDKEYSPDNTSSSLYPNVIGGKSTLLRFGYNNGVSDVFVNLFSGFIGDEFNVTPDSSSRSVSVEATDALNLIHGTKITTALYSGITVGEAIGVVLDAVGWPADKRQIDAGATVIRWWWLVDTDAYEAINDLIDSEGPPAIAHADGEGNFVFRGRHHRALDTRSTTSQATWSGGTAEPKFSKDGFAYTHGWRDVINHVTASVDERDPVTATETVWESTDTHILADGESLILEFDASDPFLSGSMSVPEWSGTSLVLYALSGYDGSPRRTLQIDASGGPAVISHIVITGLPVKVQRTVNVSQEDAASITKYNKRKTYPIDIKWAGIVDVEAIASIILAQRAERLPLVSVTFKTSVSGANIDRLIEQVTRDLSDRVTVVETQTGVNFDFYIEQISHKFTKSHEMLETTFGCEKVADVDTPSDIFILGSATNGILGTNKLAH